MTEKSVSYTCPRCGGPLDFIPGQDSVTCEYCGTKYEAKTIEDLFAHKQDM